MVITSVRREVVGFMRSRGISERRACTYAGLQRSTCRYASRRGARTQLVARIRELAAERPRFGYRRLHALLRREQDWQSVNRKLVYRLYRQEGLAVRRRKRRKLRSERPAPMPPATQPNERWAMDFVHDYLGEGRRLRTLNVVDTFTRECFAIEADTSLTGERVTRVLDALLWKHGVPAGITVDNGPEFISRALDRWAYQHSVALHFIQPGKPTQNAHVESFNGRFRDECLAQAHFPTLARARAEIELWRVDYNEKRPHSALGYETPRAFGEAARARMLLQPALLPGALRGQADSHAVAAHAGRPPSGSGKIQVHFNQTAGVT